jgi:hypothetical protein
MSEVTMPNPDEKDIVDETAAVVERLRALARCDHDDLSVAEEAADLIERLSRERGTVPEGAAYWTHEECDAAGHLYYFGIAEGVRTRGPYTNQRHVDAIIDIASDGTLAGVELIDNMPPPPLSAAPQPPSVSSEIETRTRPSPITAYCEPDDDRIFALLCARKDARTDDDAAAIAWAEDEIADLRKDRASVVELANKHVAEIERLRAELARTERNRDMWKDQCKQQAEKLTVINSLPEECVNSLTLKTQVDDSGELVGINHQAVDEIHTALVKARFTVAASPVPQNGEG